MKLRSWLKPLDTSSLNCNIYIMYQKKVAEGVWETDCDLIYAGSMWNIPYWLVDYDIAPNDEDGESIFYAHNMHKTVDDEKGTQGYDGLYIYLKEKDN